MGSKQKTDFRCQICGKYLSRKDALKRHEERICKKEENVLALNDYLATLERKFEDCHKKIVHLQEQQSKQLEFNRFLMDELSKEQAIEKAAKNTELVSFNGKIPDFLRNEKLYIWLTDPGRELMAPFDPMLRLIERSFINKEFPSYKNIKCSDGNFYVYVDEKWKQKDDLIEVLVDACVEYYISKIPYLPLLLGEEPFSESFKDYIKRRGEHNKNDEDFKHTISCLCYVTSSKK